MLKIINLKKNFGGVKAVNGCDFEVEKNTITALIGPNGSGKSTVFNLVSGILKSDNGEILFKDRNIAGMAPEKISNLGISRLFQQSRLFNNLTVEENLFLALNNEDGKFWKNLLGKNKFSDDQKEKVAKVLESVEMGKYAKKMARDLSYGQKRLIELSRAILNPHELLMLDEPVAGVNPFLRKKIAEILLELKKADETVLLIEHDMNFTLRVAEKVIVMDEGMVIAKGSPAEIKNNPRVLEAYLGE